jgi:pyruvate/2-oxoacid:ferredoxin oxidoreductase beta subunit
MDQGHVTAGRTRAAGVGSKLFWAALIAVSVAAQIGWLAVIGYAATRLVQMV